MPGRSGFGAKERAALQKLVARFLGEPEVSLIDLGSDPVTAEAILRVHLRSDRARSSLGLPAEVDGIPVRVLKGRYRPEE